jgi:predicted Fe-Mo cluster-binding NifX family protein
MKIGVSSQNFRTITGHAGKGRRFIVFTVENDREPRESARLDLPIDMSMHGWNGAGEHPLFELDYLITAGCGAGFVRKMGSRNVTVKITSETDPLTAAKALLAGNLPEREPEAHDHHHAHHHHHG